MSDLVAAIAYALARADLPKGTETSHDYAERLAPLVIESGHVPALSGKVGILAVDVGDYNAYVGYFDDPKKLQKAVDLLNVERRTDDGEDANAEVHTTTLDSVPDLPDDDFLDKLAGMLSEAGVEVERADQRRDRLREEAEEEVEDEPIVPAPGQMEMGT